MARLLMRAKVIAKLIIIIVIMSMLGSAAYFIYEAGADGVRSDMAEVVKIAVKKAREEERVKQETVNEIAQKQYIEMAAINATLNNSIDRLRKRPSRRHLPDKSKANCQGTTGESLSNEDGRFLVWEATRADRLRIALKACYKYADTIE